MQLRNKKIRFYDSWIIALLISGICNLIILFYQFPISEEIRATIFMIFSFFTIISFAVVNWGMLYNEYKNKNWIWLIISIISWLIPLGAITVSTLYYFTILRIKFEKKDLNISKHSNKDGFGKLKSAISKTRKN